MAAVLLDLEDCVVTDSGDVAFRFPALVKYIGEGKSLRGLKALRHPDIEIYNRRNPSNPISIIDIDDTVVGLSDNIFDWKLPQKYRDLDLTVYLVDSLLEKMPNPTEIYQNRLAEEISMMLERNMDQFLRALIFMVDRFVESGVVWGIGRGSCCASLVLFLIGVHMVDPVEYEIPITEFLR